MILRLKPGELRLRRRKEKGAKFVSSDQPWFQLRLGKRVTRLHARLWRAGESQRLGLRQVSGEASTPGATENVQLRKLSRAGAESGSQHAFEAGCETQKP